MTTILQLEKNELQEIIKDCVRLAIIETQPARPEQPDRIDFNEACEVTGFSKSQMYKLSHLGEIPRSHYGKKLIFSRKSLLEFMEARTISAPAAGKVMSDRLSLAAKKHLKK